MVAVEHEASPYPMGITELAHSAHRKDAVLRGLHTRQWEIRSLTGSSSLVLRGIEKEVRDLKSADLLEILNMRKAQQELGSDEPPIAEITLLRFPGEEFSEVSQNLLFFNFPNSDPHIPQLITALDLLARVAGSRDSKDILDILGDPDSVEDELQIDFIKRTHEEVRAADKKFASAEEEFDFEEMIRIEGVKESLSTKLLEQRVQGVLIDCDLFVNFYHGKNRLMIKIILDRNRWISLPASSQLINLVLESGGWDRIEISDPRLLDALLDQL